MALHTRRQMLILTAMRISNKS